MAEPDMIVLYAQMLREISNGLKTVALRPDEEAKVRELIIELRAIYDLASQRESWPPLERLGPKVRKQVIRLVMSRGAHLRERRAPLSSKPLTRRRTAQPHRTITAPLGSIPSFL